MKYETVSNPELVKSLNKFLIQQNPKNEQKLIADIHQAKFIIPVYFVGGIEDNVMKQGSSLSFKTLATEDEQTYLMAFTDWEELEKWSKKPEDVIPISYEDLRGLVLDSNGEIAGFTINPYEQNLIITRDLIAYFDQFSVN